jgi:ferrous iron transport protein A
MKLLSQLKVGQSGAVKAVLAQGALKQRLLDMGITPNTQIVLVKKAPLGDPLEISLRGYTLTLRGSEAEQIELL